MSNALITAHAFGTPHKRLLWTVPLSVLVWLVILELIFTLINVERTEERSSKEIDADLLELTPPTLAPPKTIPKSSPPKQNSPSTPAPLSPVSPKVNEVIDPTPTPSPSSQALSVPTPIDQAQPKTASAPSTSNAGPLESVSGARALFQPMPTIPDSLRVQAMQARVIARFSISEKGETDVELLQPSQSPELNRLLLKTLKTWRFFPAIKEGKPIASFQNIAINLSIAE